nr:MAG TPA: Prohead core protein serine protease [Herelleviridae sp.]
MIYGPLSFEEVQSKKGYRYRDGFWNKILSNEKVIEDIESHSMLGMIEHPKDDADYIKTPYDKASHVIWNVDLKKGVPYGTIALLNNTNGNAMKALADLGVPIGVSTRGLGEFLSDSVSEFIDEDSYALITWDFTRNPNLEKAVLSKVTDSFMETPIFREFIDAYKLRDSVDESYDHERLKKEFMLMREESMKTIERIDKILTHL